MRQLVEFQVSEEGQAAVKDAMNALHTVCEKHGVQFFAAACTGAVAHDDRMEFEMGASRFLVQDKAPNSLYVMMATYDNEFEVARSGLRLMEETNSRNEP